MKVFNFFKHMIINTKAIFKKYRNRFIKYSYVDRNCFLPEQYEASIIRLYHTIEKGLSYEDYRAGFGKDNIDALLTTLEKYSSEGFDISSFVYETALSCLYEYIRKNREYGYEDVELQERIYRLPGKPNSYGGTKRILPPISPDKMSFKQLLMTRHSIRHFSTVPVSLEKLKEAIEIAQYTPSACNRQSWKTRIVLNKRIIKSILDNQNGNRGFGNEIDKLLIITTDLRAQQKEREAFQAFIDGGMYAENILNALYYLNIGAVPLSAALSMEQEKNVRQAIDIDDAEVIILFVGVGNYPDNEILVTKSERKKPLIKIIE